jgi:hypothetical protein
VKPTVGREIRARSADRPSSAPGETSARHAIIRDVGDGAERVCNDGELCTTDSCDAKTGCVFANNTAPCNDGNACTKDLCSSSTGNCSHFAEVMDGTSSGYQKCCLDGFCTSTSGQRFIA